MSLKHKLSIIIPVICFGLAITLCFMLYKEWIKPDMIEPPLKHFYWGMTLDEAYEVLEDAGIENVRAVGANDPIHDGELWTLTPEQAQQLGYTHPGKLALSENEYYPVYVGFSSANRGGIVRLVTVSVMVEVPEQYASTSFEKKEYTIAALVKQYGKSLFDEFGLWRYGPDNYPGLSATLSQRTGPREMTLFFNAVNYLSTLYGGVYIGPVGDF